MSDKQDYSDIGEQISRALKEAAETRDFSRINKVVTDTVNGAVDEVRRQVINFSQTAGQTDCDWRTASQAGQQTASSADNSSSSSNAAGQKQSYSERYRYTYRQPGSRTMYASQKSPQSSQRQQSNQNKQQTALKKQKTASVSIRQVGKVGGILQIVFGGIGLGTFAMIGLGIWALGMIQSTLSVMPIGVMMLLCLVCGGFIGKGCKTLGRLKRAERYAKLGAKNMFLELEDIARNSGRSLKKVRTDVKKMLKLGIFPEGHMDKQESCLILNDETWQQYKLTQKEWENRKKMEESKAAENVSQDGAEASVMQIVREGQAYMDRLRQLNIEIPGEVISNKLYQLDYLLTRIFAVIREHPERCPQMRKFMEYYLPTTVKLVEAYADFDKAGVQGENIISAKTEIEKTMDTINQAFEKLLDDIYLNAAMETTADAQVLKTLLAQDGYTKSDFDIKG